MGLKRNPEPQGPVALMRLRKPTLWQRMPWSRHQRMRRRGFIDRATAREIQHAPFPIFGVPGWPGRKRLAGHGSTLRDRRMRLNSVRLHHVSADGAVTITVESCLPPHGTQVELRQDGPHAAIGQVEIRVQDETLTLTRYPVDAHDRREWAAAGEVDGLQIAVEATGIEPAAVHLAPVDPRPYLKGSRLPSPRAGARGRR